MAFSDLTIVKYKDRVRDFTLSASTPFALEEEPPLGYQGFGDILANGERCHFVVLDTNGTWALYRGDYSATGVSISALTFLDGSATAPSWSSERKEIFLVAAGTTYEEIIAEIARLGALTASSLPVPIGSGGTSATSAAGARTALGLGIGVDVQAWDVVLDGFAALSAASQIPFFSAASTVGSFGSQAYGRTLLDVANEAAFKALINAEAGVDFQAWDVVLDGFAALTTASHVPFFSAASTVSSVGSAAYGRSLLSASDATALAALTGTATTPVSIANGGTSATSVTDALANFGLTRKNAIINGDFNIWQRGTSFAAIASGTYHADRWTYVNNGTAAVHTVSRSTDVPSVAAAGRLFNYSLLVDCTTADAAVAASDRVQITHKVEGYNWLPLAQRAVVISFWVKATKTGIYCVALRSSNADRSYVGEYTVNASDTWEFKTVAVLASPSAGTWDYTTGIGLLVDFTLMCGSTFQTTAGAWQTGSFVGTANQVNACDDVANNFRLCGVQLELGSVATEFEAVPFDVQLARCQRYYMKSYSTDVDPGAATALGRVAVALQTNINTRAHVRFPVEMRAAPTISRWDAAGNASRITAIDAANAETNNVNSASTLTTDIGAGGFAFNDAAGAGNAGATAVMSTSHFTANAEL